MTQPPKTVDAAAMLALADEAKRLSDYDYSSFPIFRAVSFLKAVEDTLRLAATAPPAGGWNAAIEAAANAAIRYHEKYADDGREGMLRANAAAFGKSIAESIRSLTRPTPTAPEPSDEDETYEIGKRDGYEEAIQDLDIATGGDGEFKGSTIPGGTVDVPAMRQRIIDRLSVAPDPEGGEQPVAWLHRTIARWQAWREADHEDAVSMSRSDVCTLLDEIKRLSARPSSPAPAATDKIITTSDGFTVRTNTDGRVLEVLGGPARPYSAATSEKHDV